MRPNLRSDLRDIIDRAIEQGWEVRQTAKNHLALVPPDRSKPIVTCSGTPRNQQRGRANVLALMRASGFDDGRQRGGRNPGSVRESAGE